MKKYFISLLFGISLLCNKVFAEEINSPYSLLINAFGNDVLIKKNLSQNKSYLFGATLNTTNGTGYYSNLFNLQFGIRNYFHQGNNYSAFRDTTVSVGTESSVNTFGILLLYGIEKRFKVFDGVSFESGVGMKLNLQRSSNNKFQYDTFRFPYIRLAAGFDF